MQSHLVSILYTMPAGLSEMRKTNTLCDVVINTQDDKYYSIHSAVLGGSSAFFCQILTQSKSAGVGIILKLEKPSVLVEAMINFMYTGHAVVSLVIPSGD